MNGQNLTKFCILIITDKIYVGIVMHHQFFKLEFMFMKHYAPNGCELSIEALNFGGWGGGRGQGRCERRSYFFVKIIFFFGGGQGGFRVNVNGEVKFF